MLLVGGTVGEGASFVTANLGILFAQTSRRVIIVDCDLRKPQQHLIWEICCSPESWLSEACRLQELRPFRVNLANGFDLNKSDTYVRMTELYKSHRPKKLWVSTKCTVWCPFQSLNYNTPERQEVLEARRRKERATLRLLTSWLLQVLRDDPTVDVFWEWPLRCYGWSQKVMQDFEAALWNLEREWRPCRIDGCRYNLKSGEPGSEDLFLQKKWLIKTTDVEFHARFKTKICTKNHTHKPIEGRDTSRSAYYPWSMVVAIARHWKSQLLPLRWLGKLRLAHDEQMTDSAFELQVLGRGQPSSALHDHLPVMDDGDEEFEEHPAPPARRPRWSQAGHGLWKSDQAVASPEPEVSEEERVAWRARLSHFHKAAGHPTNRNLARVLKEAQKPQWQIEECMKFRCSACEAVKPGGSSSKQIPPASLTSLPKPWQVVLMDIGEWPVLSHQIKVKFLLMMDGATKLKVVVPLMEYAYNKQLNESTQQVIDAVCVHWIARNPKPVAIIPDNACTMTSTSFSEFCS